MDGRRGVDVDGVVEQKTERRRGESAQGQRFELWALQNQSERAVSTPAEHAIPECGLNSCSSTGPADYNRYRGLLHHKIPPRKNWRRKGMYR
ncbi:hypothetical protein Dda_9143 [Drechslerella dactyloides]|uniref:Uncharacterized protein n=1 Tax=Drechslerella dactyloides TaxID=74499 RepID=A0AAD6IS94_DREDA|nr:hypothetical protein Dda_9143 [Drechslerella dactyloides]